MKWDNIYWWTSGLSAPIQFLTAPSFEVAYVLILSECNSGFAQSMLKCATQTVNWNWTKMIDDSYISCSFLSWDPDTDSQQEHKVWQTVPILLPLYYPTVIEKALLTCKWCWSHVDLYKWTNLPYTRKVQKYRTSHFCSSVLINGLFSLGRKFRN